MDNQLIAIGGPNCFGIVEGTHRIEGLIQAFILTSDYETDEDDYTATLLSDYPGGDSDFAQELKRKVPLWNKLADLFVMQ